MLTRNRNTLTASQTVAAAAPSLVEPLESRRLMSATVLFGALVVTGTDGPDTVVVSMNATHSNKLDVTVNEVTKSFNLNRIKLGIHMLGRGGDDTLVVDDSNGTVTPFVTMHGGAGNDVVFGGTGNDALFGNDGDDMLFGNDGNDLLDGGDGNDMAFGGFGDDLIAGGRGDDYLGGELGRDHLYGGDGIDALEGSDDADYLNGGAGSDVVLGGLGGDTFAASDDASEILDLTSEDVHLV